MKKILSIMATALMLLPFAGCSSEEPTLPDEAVETSNLDETGALRSPREAAGFAVDAKNIFGENGRSRSMADVVSVEAVTGHNSRSGASDTLFYAVNFADNEGYALISANRDIEPVLAVTESGTFVEDSLKDGIRDFVEMAKAYTYSLIPTEPKPTPDPGPEHRLYWEIVNDTTANVSIPTKVNAAWGQRNFYAKYCPLPPALSQETMGYTGCVPTAIAMIMSYFEYPKTLITRFDGSDKFVYLNWNDVNKHTKMQINCNIDWIGDELCHASKEAHDKIALLMREIGHQAKADYNITYKVTYPDGASRTQYGTSCTKGNEIIALKYFGFNVSQYYSFSEAINKLNDSNILLACGITSGSESAHAFIIDGVQELRYNRFERYWDTYYTPWKLYSETLLGSYDSHLIHINWGWDGDHNGMYNSGVFKPSSYVTPDNPQQIPDYNLSGYYNVECCVISLN